MLHGGFLGDLGALSSAGKASMRHSADAVTIVLEGPRHRIGCLSVVKLDAACLGGAGIGSCRRHRPQALHPSSRMDTMNGPSLRPIAVTALPVALLLACAGFVTAGELQAIRHGDMKYFLKSGELYDLDQDLGEANNLARERPEVVSEIERLLPAIEADLGINGIGPGCRALGTVSNPVPLIPFD